MGLVSVSVLLIFLFFYFEINTVLWRSRLWGARPQFARCGLRTCGAPPGRLLRGASARLCGVGGLFVGQGLRGSALGLVIPAAEGEGIAVLDALPELGACGRGLQRDEWG